MMHTMSSSLATSDEIANLPIWTEFYKLFFLDVESTLVVNGPGLAQQFGLDRRITQAGRIGVITADEKVRAFNANFTDVLLEHWSVFRGPGHPENVAGWIEKPLECDYIAYVWPGRKKALMLPVQQLQLAWKRNKEAWLREFGERAAVNETYDTISCPVKEETLLRAIAACFSSNLPEHLAQAIIDVQKKRLAR